MWRNGVFPTFLSALIGLEIIANIAWDPTITVISNGVIFYLPAGYAVFPLSLLVIYSLVAMRAEFSKLRRALGKAT